MKNKYLIQDIWIVNYSVPYKDKDKLFRPFIITNIINDVVYGILQIVILSATLLITICRFILLI